MFKYILLHTDYAIQTDSGVILSFGDRLICQMEAEGLKL
jgi:hypothetical protein